jgi:hypothetical protein
MESGLFSARSWADSNCRNARWRLGLNPWRISWPCAAVNTVQSAVQMADFAQIKRDSRYCKSLSLKQYPGIEAGNEFCFRKRLKRHKNDPQYRSDHFEFPQAVPSAHAGIISRNAGVLPVPLILGIGRAHPVRVRNHIRSARFAALCP